MNKKITNILLIVVLLSSCAEREINIIDNGKIIGGCNAGYDWHLYGLQDSIDYMLYLCAKESIEKGLTISDKRLLAIDFTLPKPPNGLKWNKKLAMQHFKEDKISERHFGYILAQIEYDYQKIVWPAEDDLAAGKISESEFRQIISDAKLDWLGE